MAKKDVIFVLLLVLALFCLYQHTFKYDLIWDTKLFVNESVLFKDNISVLSVFKYGYIYDQLGINQQSFYYRPIVNLSFFVENRLWGLHSSCLRLLNLLIFSLALVFLFLLLKKQDQGWRFAVMTTVLFAFSPLNSENIIWVVGRCDLFLLLWGILAWFFLQLFIEKENKAFLFWSAGFFVLGIFSKETFVFFLPVLIAYEWIKTKRITWVYHLFNLLAILVFFLIKNFFLGIGSLQVFVPPVFDAITTALSVFGYYIRLLCFPVGTETFTFVHKVISIQYLGAGIFFIILILAVFFRTKGDRKNPIPLILLGFFMLPYIILAFTSLWPFRISARYMMLPFLGFIWFLCGYLTGLKKIFQSILVALLMVLFIPEIITSSSRYRSERQYWEEALVDHPENSFVNLKAAEACYDERDDISSEYYLSQALKYPMGQVTAIGIAVSSAKLEYQRMEYEKSLGWLNRITFRVLPAWRYQINKLKARIFVSRGNVFLAEDILKASIEQFGEKVDLYRIITGMYIGQNLWDKARDWQQITANRFPGLLVPDVKKLEQNFNQMPAENKMGFYIHYQNYHKAVEILQDSDITGLDKKLLLVELYYKAGESSLGKNNIEQLVSENPGNWKMINAIAFFYLKRLNRPAESLPFFQLSLKANKDQPKVIQLVSRLKIQLAKL